MSNPKTDKLAKDLVEAALLIHRARPWERITQSSPFLLDTEGDALVLCMVLTGDDPETNSVGLWFKIGENAIHSYLYEEFTGETAPEELSTTEIGLSFVALQAVNPDYRKLLIASDRSFAKGATVPLLFKFQGEEASELVSRTEQREILKALRIILAAERTNDLNPTPVIPGGKISNYRLQGHGKKATAIETRERVPNHEIPKLPPDYEEYDDYDELELDDEDLLDAAKHLPQLEVDLSVGIVEFSRQHPSLSGKALLLCLQTPGPVHMPVKMIRKLTPQSLSHAIFGWLEDPMADIERDDNGEPTQYIAEGLPRVIRIQSENVHTAVKGTFDEIGVETQYTPDQPDLDAWSDQLRESFKQLDEFAFEPPDHMT